MTSPGPLQDQAAVKPTAESAQATALLKRARTGDRGAYGQLVMLYQDRLFNAVVRLVGDREEAAELTQEAFTRGLAALDRFRDESAPYTWLFRIAVNLSISRLRKVHRHRVFSLDRPTTSNGQSHRGGDQAAELIDRMRQSAPSPPQAMEQRERAEQVVAALGRIDPEYRADVLGLPLGTLKSRLFRARVALRDELKAYMGK
jgi:RNA polymerase sigma-70 factor (ECF subfamily)